MGVMCGGSTEVFNSDYGLIFDNCIYHNQRSGSEVTTRITVEVY